MCQALLLIVVLAPLPLGSNRPWAWSLLALATGAVLVLWLHSDGFIACAQAISLQRWMFAKLM
jgi:hypothetical protein